MTSYVVTFQNEDHTIGYLLTTQLQKDPLVEFAGYHKPQRTKPGIEIDMRLKGSGDDQAVDVRNAYVRNSRKLQKDLDLLALSFRSQLLLFKDNGERTIPPHTTKPTSLATLGERLNKTTDAAQETNEVREEAESPLVIHAKTRSLDADPNPKRRKKSTTIL